MPEIVITPDGESSSAPGAAVTLTFAAVDGAGKLVTLGLDDASGITEYFWEILDQDKNAVATLDDPTSSTPTFTMTQDVSGTYLLRVTLNGGQYVRESAIAVRTLVLGARKPAAGETRQVDDVDGWKTSVNEFIDQAEVVAKGSKQEYVMTNNAQTAENVDAIVGAVYVDPGLIPDGTLVTTTFKLQFLLSTTPGRTAYVTLRDVTAGSDFAVQGPISGTVPTLFEQSIPLPTVPTVYAVKLRMDIAGGDGERAFLHYAGLQAKWSFN